MELCSALGGNEHTAVGHGASGNRRVSNRNGPDQLGNLVVRMLETAEPDEWRSRPLAALRCEGQDSRRV